MPTAAVRRWGLRRRACRGLRGVRAQFSRCFMAGQLCGGAECTRGSFSQSGTAFEARDSRLCRVCAIAAPEEHGTRVQNSGVISSYGMFLGVTSIPKLVVVDW
eukprot:1094436-Prymnesium_polylepis.1